MSTPFYTGNDIDPSKLAKVLHSIADAIEKHQAIYSWEGKYEIRTGKFSTLEFTLELPYFPEILPPADVFKDKEQQ